jgi:hypothetical protein
VYRNIRSLWPQLSSIFKFPNMQEFMFWLLPVPVTCIERANVRTRARFSSSDSADTKVLGSLRNRDNCGCTSALPKPVIRRNAVLSTLQMREVKSSILMLYLLCYYPHNSYKCQAVGWRRQPPDKEDSCTHAVYAIRDTQGVICVAGVVCRG